MRIGSSWSNASVDFFDMLVWLQERWGAELGLMIFLWWFYLDSSRNLQVLRVLHWLLYSLCWFIKHLIDLAEVTKLMVFIKEIWQRYLVLHRWLAAALNQFSCRYGLIDINIISHVESCLHARLYSLLCGSLFPICNRFNNRLCKLQSLWQKWATGSELPFLRWALGYLPQLRFLNVLLLFFLKLFLRSLSFFLLNSDFILFKLQKLYLLAICLLYLYPVLLIL